MAYHVIDRTVGPCVQSVETLAAVAAFQVALRPVAARVASEMLYASKCVVTLGAPEGPLKMVRIESSSAGSHASIYRELVRMGSVF